MTASKHTKCQCVWTSSATYPSGNKKSRVIVSWQQPSGKILTGIHVRAGADHDPWWMVKLKSSISDHSPKHSKHWRVLSWCNRCYSRSFAVLYFSCPATSELVQTYTFVILYYWKGGPWKNRDLLIGTCFLTATKNQVSFTAEVNWYSSTFVTMSEDQSKQVSYCIALAGNLCWIFM